MAHEEVSRRSFIKGSCALATAGMLSGSLVGCSNSGDGSREMAATGDGAVADPGTWVQTKCNMCFNGCSIKVHLVDGVMTEIEGNESSSYGSGRICAKGAAGLMQYYDPNRITKPMKRTNPEKGLGVDPGWEEITWDEAYDLIIENFGKAYEENPRWGGTFSSIVSNVSSTSSVGAGLACAFGGSFLLYADICGQSIHRVTGLMTGTGNACPDYKYSKYVVQFGMQGGAVTRHGTPQICDIWAESRANGAKLVNFDPFLSTGASIADKWVPIKPATDGAAALALCYVMVHEIGKLDVEFLKKRTNACSLVNVETKRILFNGAPHKSMYMDSDDTPKMYDEASDPLLEGEFEIEGVKYKTAFTMLKEHLAKWTPEYQESITTVPAETIRAIAKEFVEAACIGETITIDGFTMPYRPVAADYFSGVARYKNSLPTCAAISLMNLLVGSLNTVGGMRGFVPACSGMTPDSTLKYRPDIWEDEGFINEYGMCVLSHHSIYEEAWKEDWTPAAPDYKTLAPMAFDPHMYHLNQTKPEMFGNLFKPATAWFIYGSNPLKWWGNTDQMIEFFNTYDYIVCNDIYLNDSSYFADLFIPEACYLERTDIVKNTAPLNHHTIAVPGGNKCLDVMQPVIPPDDGRPVSGALGLFAEITKRRGAESYGNYMAAMGNLHLMKPEYFLKADEPFDVDKYCDGYFKSVVDEEHDYTWFKENGTFATPYLTEDIYLWADGGAGRVPLYWDFMLQARDGIKAKVEELGFEYWDFNNYNALPEWFPVPCQEQSDDVYDLFPIFWTSAQNTDTWQTQNAYLSEITDNETVGFGIAINPATAQAKGLADGDKVKLVTKEGFTSEGRVSVTDGIHPEALAVAVGSLNSTSDFLPIGKGKGVSTNNLLDGFDPYMYDFASFSWDMCSRVKIEKID